MKAIWHHCKDLVMLWATLNDYRGNDCELCANRVKVQGGSLRHGLWQHYHLGVQFDADAVFREEGKAVMATQYKVWRMKAVVITRWQRLTVQHK